MAKRQLSFVTYSDDGSVFQIDGNGFETLERAYAAKIPDLARPQLIAIAEAYISSRRAEKSWQTWNDVEAKLQPFADAANAMWGLAHERETRSDAASQFEELLERVLANEPVKLKPQGRDLLELTDAGWSEIEEIPYTALAFRLSPRLISELAMAMKVALNKISAEIGSHLTAPIAPLYPPRQTAMDVFILALTDWADKFNLPKAPYVHGEIPNKFSLFACALLALIPEELRETSFGTPGGMAAEVRRVRAFAKRYKREQAQRVG